MCSWAAAATNTSKATPTKPRCWSIQPSMHIPTILHVSSTADSLRSRASIRGPKMESSKNGMENWNVRIPSLAIHNRLLTKFASWTLLFMGGPSRALIVIRASASGAIILRLNRLLCRRLMVKPYRKYLVNRSWGTPVGRALSAPCSTSKARKSCWKQLATTSELN